MLICDEDGKSFAYQIKQLFGIGIPMFSPKVATANSTRVPKRELIQAAFSEADDIMTYIRSHRVFYNIRMMVKRQNSYCAYQQLINSVAHQAGYMTPMQASRVLFDQAAYYPEFASIIDELTYEMFGVEPNFSAECRAISKMIVSAVIFSESYMHIRDANYQCFSVYYTDTSPQQYYVQQEQLVLPFYLDYIRLYRCVLASPFAQE